MLLRRGAGRVKHLSTKQLWVQGAIESHGIAVRKITRALNPADFLTHIASTEDAQRFMYMLGYSPGRQA